MLLFVFLTCSCILSFVAGDTVNTTLYQPLFQPYSNSTPVFKNFALIKELSSNGKGNLGRRDTTDLPTGTCAPGTPCTNGACCSNTGVCSYAPSSCSPEYCISNCNAKAPCGEYANPNNATCPLNVCCSQYGFCGTTDDFCGTGCQAGYGDCGPVNIPSCAGTSASARTIGYYESWASTRTCDTRDPEDIDLTALTHINFAFAFFDPTTFQISPMDDNSGTLWKRFTNLKSKKASLKTWISIGGWSFNDDTNSPNTRTAFSNMVSSAANRQTFISTLTSFMTTYGFDGVDIDWEYPGADDRGGVPADTANYVSLVQELRAAFGSNYGISATVPSSFWYLQHFDINSMQSYLDWFNFMSYDIHGVWDSSDKYTGPYIRPHTNLTEIELGLQLMWRAGVDSSKVVLGLGWYGRSFTLTDPTCTTPNGICQFSAGGNPGQCTNSAGTLSNAEILRIIAAGGTVESYDSTAAVKWITWDTNQWVSFDDGETMQQKIQAANDLCLGGIMIWSIDQDNTNGDSMSDLLGIGTANGVSEAESQAFKDQLNNATLQQDIANSCYWSLCGETCQAGYFDVADAKGQVSGVQQSSVCSNGDYQTLCCAPGTTMGTCQWEGWRGVGMPCTPVCNDTSATVIAQNSNSYYVDGEGLQQDLTCTGGYQAFCCSGFVPSSKTNTGDLFLYGQGVFSKRDLTVLEKRGKGSTIVALTAAACAAAVGAMILAAPFTFGLSLLGIPEEVAACAAAGIAVAATGFVAIGSGSGQSNPKGTPPVSIPKTGVPTTVGGRSSYGQWPILYFGAASTKGCDCSVTYTCNYGMGWDEVCDNQRWAMDVMFQGRKSVFTVMASGRAALRKQRLWASSHSAAFRTPIQVGGGLPYVSQCQVDEFPMGNLADSGNNNPQACRLVNAAANGAQGNDYNAWKSAQWTPCSSFRKTVCRSSSAPLATWAFGNLNGNRGNANGKHFVTAYGFDSQTPNALCYASYTFTGANNARSNTNVADHGFRVLLDDPMFGGAFGWTRQNWLVNPVPKTNSNLRPTSMASAKFLKRDLEQVEFNEDDGGYLPPEDLDEYLLSEGFSVEDMGGNPISAQDCDILYDDYSESTIILTNENGFAEAVTTSVQTKSPITSVNAISPTTTTSTQPKATLASTFPAQTGMER